MMSTGESESTAEPRPRRGWWHTYRHITHSVSHSSGSSWLMWLKVQGKQSAVNFCLNPLHNLPLSIQVRSHHHISHFIRSTKQTRFALTKAEGTLFRREENGSRQTLVYIPFKVFNSIFLQALLTFAIDTSIQQMPFPLNNGGGISFLPLRPPCSTLRIQDFNVITLNM